MLRSLLNMILHLKKNTPEHILKELQQLSASFLNEKKNYFQYVNSSSQKLHNENLKPYIIDQYLFDNDIQIASIKYQKSRTVSINNLSIGRDTKKYK